MRRHRLNVYRLGVTLMETIFAIGIIMTGLLGLAHLIPIASGNAQRTLELDRSISEATSVAASGNARQMTEFGTLVIFDELIHGSAVNVAQGYVPQGNLQTLRNKLEVQVLPLPFPPLLIGKLDSPGYSHMPRLSGLSAGICIDPLGVPSTVYRAPHANAAVANANDAAFTFSRFPYYTELYDPMREPNQSGTLSFPVPRMYRATVRLPMFPHPLTPALAAMTPTPVPQPHLMSQSLKSSIFRGLGGIEGVDASEEGFPRGVALNRTQLPGGTTSTFDMTTESSSQYTWFATLAPDSLGGDGFRQSIVVVRQRESVTPRRANDPLALNEVIHTVEEADDNPAAERVAWVSEAQGFDGTGGGDLRLVGSEMVSSEIKENEWVMLSRQPHTPAPGLLPTGPAIHQWYRVVRVEEAIEDPAFVYPGNPGGSSVWTRWVSLAGPSWRFQDEATVSRPITGTTLSDDTFVTIVDGAISVIESEVRLQ